MVPLKAQYCRCATEPSLNSRCLFAFDNLQVDRNRDIPIHRQIYSAIRGYILEGRLGPEMSLPATRSLAQSLGVGRNTVIAAYDQLLAEGYVEERSGLRTWVARLLHRPNVPRRQDDVRADGRRLSRRGGLVTARPQPGRTVGALNLHPGAPDTSASPLSTWASVVARNAKRRDDDMLGIRSFSGHPLLRQTVADYLSVARGIDCTAEQVVIVTGAQAGLDLVARILMDVGEVAWMEEPGYLGAATALMGCGARLAPLRVTRQGWRLSDPQLPPPRLVYVTPSCQWPLGTIMRMEERLQLLALAERHGAWIVEDDCDGEYRFRGRPVPALRGLDGAQPVIYVGTFGKTLFSSFRLGYLVVPIELAADFNQALSVTGQFAPVLLQVSVADFIRGGHFATHLKRMRRLYARRQERFIELCRDTLGRWITLVENDSGMQLFGKFSVSFNDCAVAAAALRRGVDVQPVSINYHYGKPEHGLLLGYDERDMQRAIGALRDAFRDVEVAAATDALWFRQIYPKWFCCCGDEANNLSVLKS
jgi:GntR family transcriptional regulator/MocR family aminotransferase